MLSPHRLTKRRVRSAVKTTRKAVNKALDVAEPRLEAAAAEIHDLGQEAVSALRKGTRQGLAALETGYGQIERKIRRRINPPARGLTTGKVALLAAGLAAVTVGLLRNKD